MVGILVLLVFATVGSKILLGLAAIYLLLPTERSCPACDGETLPLRGALPAELLCRLFRIQRRWCTRCGRSALARRSREPRVFVGPADAPRVREPTG